MGKLLRQTVLIFSASIFLLICSALLFAGEDNYRPEDGYVPDEETAIKIAVAVWTPIYGKVHIKKEKPYKAVLKDGVWHVSGSLPEGYLGGVAEAEISKENGCVLRVIHGK